MYFENEYFPNLRFQYVKNRINDDFVQYSYTINPAQEKIKLSYTKKGDIFEVELKSVDDEDNILVKWEGPIKDKWW